MVRSGEEVQIIDNNTKDDLTEITLAQIIYEEQKARSRNVPLQTLKELIHARTEKVLADLREGPIGRLIPGTKVGDEKVEVATKDAKPTLVDQAKEKFEEMQHNLDERVRTVLASFRPLAAAPARGQTPERASRGAGEAAEGRPAQRGVRLRRDGRAVLTVGIAPRSGCSPSGSAHPGAPDALSRRPDQGSICRRGVDAPRRDVRRRLQADAQSRPRPKTWCRTRS